MKMVKSLLLGSAASLVAVAGAQAADLPVKAAPVQYVKICSLYGVGFYYIPGTDMCLKIGGWVRAEYGWGMNGSSTQTYGANALLNNRATNNEWWRIRGYITADARNQTEYGTVRSYIAVGISTDEAGPSLSSVQNFNANRAFIQWAGFTFGRAQSFFDFYAGAAVSYFGFYPQSDTGDGGHDVLAYTAQFGNGFSASISAEQPRRTQIISSTGFGTSTTVGNVGTVIGGANQGQGYGGFQAPDIVANLRVDQAWGSAQIAVAAHQVTPLYYVNATSAIGPEGSGHPDDKWGFAISGGLKLNAPMIGQGDFFQTQVNYTQGASRYIFMNPLGNPFIQEGDSVAYGVVSDAVYGGTLGAATATDLELTTAWNVNASFEHFWNPRWRTSIHGGYAQVKYGDRANAIMCVLQGDGTGFGTAAVANAGCDNDFSWWWVGTRTQWNVTKDFYMGLDIAYSKIQSATSSDGLFLGPFPSGTNTSARFINDQDNWQFRFRVHRDFYP